MTTIQDRIIKASISIQKVAYEMANARDKAFKAGEIKDGKTTNEWKEYRKAKVKLSQEISQSIKLVEQETRKETLDLIAEDQGWEESRDIYADALGLPLKYPKLMEDYKKRNHIKGRIILDCQKLSITNKDKKNV